MGPRRGPHRLRRRLGDVPELVERVLLAAEDEGFRDHHRFDPRGIARALVRNATAGGIAEGGSTITQQLAKNLFTGDDETFERSSRSSRWPSTSRSGSRRTRSSPPT